MEEEIRLEKKSNLGVHMHEDFEGWILDPKNTHIILALFNRTLGLYWLIKYLLGRTIFERGDNYGDLHGHMEDIKTIMGLLSEVSYLLKVIKVKYNLLTKDLGYIFKVSKVDKEHFSTVPVH